MNDGDKDFWRLLIAYVCPPAAVYMQVGATQQFWINLILTVALVWVGGQIHAAWVITSVQADGSTDPGGTRKLVSVLTSFYVPPVGVALQAGVGVPLLLSIILSFVGWIPGVIHAVWVITRTRSS